MGDLHIGKPWLLPERSHHAELPLWDEDSQSLYWVDMEPSPSVHRVSGLDEATHVRADFPAQELAGGVFLRRGQSHDRLLVGTKLGWGSAIFDGRKKTVANFTELVDVQRVTSANSASSWKPLRLNEATTDPKGRLWFATCAEGDSDVKPALYLFDPAQDSVSEVPCEPASLTMPNAMCFAGDTRFYLGCSQRGKVWSWDVTLDAKEPADMLKNGRIVLDIPKPAVPDGMTVDSQGNLYLAVFNSGSVQVFTPDGQRLRTITLPAQSPTCTAFAGPNLDELIITTHAVNEAMRREIVDAGQASTVDEVERRWPEAQGGIYRVQLAGVRGVAKPRVL